MFTAPITYLPSTDRNRLDRLKEIIDSSRFTQEERTEAVKERDEIEKKRKPLAEATYEEAQEFRVFLFQKYRKLVAAGAAQQAMQFQQYIQRIEQHIMAIQYESAKKALAEEQNKVEIGKGLRQNDRAKPRRTGVSAGPAKNPWAIPLDDEH